ncbi:hypothetical protein SNE40_002175 [Patella caerulea]|uniref:Uncharacterized protein n=1 Tax=Patella caerulea TaxID=87958 RepID=A0AAN8QE02_PATCE
MAPSVSQIIVLVGGSVAFLLLTVGIFYPHWLKPFDKSDYTVPLFGAVYCIGDVCYSAAVVPVDYYYEPGWLMAGRILSCFGLFSVIGGMISQLLYMRWQTDLLHIMALILFATGGKCTL